MFKTIEVFQFLIGRLKTLDPDSEEAQKLKFQFLIGRLKTQDKQELSQQMISVSIPDR